MQEVITNEVEFKTALELLCEKRIELEKRILGIDKVIDMINEK